MMPPASLLKPGGLDPQVLLFKWKVVRSFDRAEDCENFKKSLPAQRSAGIEKYKQSPEFLALTPAARKSALERAERVSATVVKMAQCIASDDPRLQLPFKFGTR